MEQSISNAACTRGFPVFGCCRHRDEGLLGTSWFLVTLQASNVLVQDTFILAKYWFNSGRPVPI